MSILTLERFNYSETETEGYLWLDAETRLYTIERPWRAGPPGGVPRESCVPDGSYRLLPHTRPDGTEVLALRNTARGVYYTEEERGDRPGRFLILLHAGNTTDDIVGCIAPGEGRTIHKNRRMVTSSRKAMQQIMAREWSTIIIRPTRGTVGG